MQEGILLRMNEDGVFEEYKDPFMTIECPTEQDFQHLQDAVRYMEAHSWIPVDERLPDRSGLMLDESEYVLVCEAFPFGGHNVSICAYTAEGWSDWDNYGSVKPANITHWMPLPQPPKEGTPNG